MTPVDNMDKLTVDPVRESLMALKIRADTLKIKSIYILHIVDGMRISHADARKFKIFPVHRDLLRKLARKPRHTHIHLHSSNFPVLNLHIKTLDPGKSLHGDPRLIHKPVVISVFPHTADTVSAHGPLAAVLIEHAHPYVRDLGRTDEDQAVRPNPEMAVADKPRHPRRIVHTLLKAVHIHIIIADSLHLCKPHVRLLTIL